MAREQSIRQIQAWWRGNNLRIKLREQTDDFTFACLRELIERYISDVEFTKKFNLNLSRKKKRNPNLPSEITENIVKFVICKIYKIMPTWWSNKGDLAINKPGIFKQIEVKGFTSSGPSSFGPTESWDMLYFVDAEELIHGKFKVYQILLSNTNKIFRDIPLSKKETYGDIADSRRRPRGSFNNIFKPQLGHHCKLIFDGHISDLDNFP